MAIEMEQSIPLCLLLSAVGGMIEVLATAVLAYQDAQERQSMTKWSLSKSRAALAVNVTLQVTSSVVGNLFAPWFGPVSIVGPVYLAAQLVANMGVFGSALGLSSFTKDMRVGTYVVVTAVVMLPVVGPAAQEGQDVMTLLSTWWALTWSALNVLCMTASCALLIVLDMDKLRETRRAVLLLLSARASSFTVNLTVSRIFVLGPSITVFITSLILKVSSGAINTHALVVQATAVEQAVFVPLNASVLILINAVTGLVVWEDWRVVGSWVGYVCVFVQLVLGNYLLLGEHEVEALGSDNTKYGAAKSVRMMLKPERMRTLEMALSYDSDEAGKEEVVDSGRAVADSVLVGRRGRRRETVGMNQLSVVHEDPGEGAAGETYVKFVDDGDDGVQDDDAGSPNSASSRERLTPPSSLSREPRRRRPTRKQAWSVVYGMDDDVGGGRRRGGTFRRTSIFARDDGHDAAAEELASIRQII